MTECYHDVIHYASEIGRLDIVSLVLGLVSVGLVIVGLFVLFNSRSIAKAEAREAAEEIARKVAKNYIEASLGAMGENQPTEATQENLSDKSGGTSVTGL